MTLPSCTRIRGEPNRWHPGIRSSPAFVSLLPYVAVTRRTLAGGRPLRQTARLGPKK